MGDNYDIVHSLVFVNSLEKDTLTLLPADELMALVQDKGVTALTWLGLMGELVQVVAGASPPLGPRWPT